MSKVNKKMKKVAAAIAVATLSMSMSMGVFASSPVDPEIPNTEDPKPEKPADKPLPPLWGAWGTDKDGNRVTASSKGEISKEVEEVLKDEEKVKDILESAGYDVKEDQNTVVLGVGDLELIGGEVPEGGVDLNLNLYEYMNEGVEDLKAGDTLYILHQKSDGTWEVLEGKVTLGQYGYTVNAHFDSLSPVAIVKIMSDGKVAVLDKDGQQAGILEPESDSNKVAKDETGVKVVKTTTVKKSPKTGN